MVPKYGMYTYGMYTYGMYTYGMYTYGMYIVVLLFWPGDILRYVIVNYLG